MLGTGLVFGFLFLPYAAGDGLQGIADNVLGYGGLQGRFGLTLFAPAALVTAINAAAGLLIPVLFRERIPLYWLLALSAVFTFSFSPAYAPHYATLVLATAALVSRVRPWFVIFSALTFGASLATAALIIPGLGSAISPFEGVLVLTLWVAAVVGFILLLLFALRFPAHPALGRALNSHR